MSTREAGRRIEVEVRGLPGPRQMLMIIDEKMKMVRDLAAKLKFVCKDIKKTDEIKIHRDRFLLPDKENINIIETGEKIIAFINATETEYVEYEDNKETLLKVRMDILKEQENKLEIKEKELKEKEEAFVKRKDDEETLLNVKMEALNENENKLEIKEKEMKEKEAFLKNWEDNLKKKEADLKAEVEKTAERSRKRQRENSMMNALAVGLNLSPKQIKLIKADPSFTKKDLKALGFLNPGETSSSESCSDSYSSSDTDY